jgi:hypothetical protein
LKGWHQFIGGGDASAPDSSEASGTTGNEAEAGRMGVTDAVDRDCRANDDSVPKSQMSKSRMVWFTPCDRTGSGRKMSELSLVLGGWIALGKLI